MPPSDTAERIFLYSTCAWNFIANWIISNKSETLSVCLKIIEPPPIILYLYIEIIYIMKSTTRKCCFIYTARGEAWNCVPLFLFISEINFENLLQFFRENKI